MADKRDRDPFASRYDQNSQEGEEKTENSAKNEKSEDASKTEKTKKTPLKERTNINMYIEDESLIDDLQLQYKRLDLEFQGRHGEDLPKNDLYYPLVLKLALEKMDEMNTEEVLEKMG